MAESVPEVARSAFAHLDLHQLLQQPTSSLLGVSDAAQQALRTLGIETVFDLGASSVFAQARAAASAAQVGAPSARFGIAPSDWLHLGATFESLEEIGRLDLRYLRAVPPADAAAIKGAFDVQTIRDLAYWPPHLRARALVGRVTGSDLDPENLQTEELRPRMGEYPTERVYYSTLVMLQMQEDNQAGPLAPLDRPVPLTPAVERRTGFNKPAVGAILTYSQSWYAQGITLGHLLHCLALAPGEATRIAVVDWLAKRTARAEESAMETEQLDSATTHSRALSEVQNAVASEMQSGGSTANTRATSMSESETWSGSSGIVQSVFGSSSSGSGTSQAATTEASARSTSWSIGNRSVTAELTQNVNDRTEQYASAARNRRASAVREVSQSEHEQVSTRVVANYNHMHALTVQYYEVVQIYRTIAQLQRAVRCLFVPMELLDFMGPDATRLVDHFRGSLVRAARTRRAFSLLTDDTTAVAIKPIAPTRLFGRRPEVAAGPRDLVTLGRISPGASQPSELTGTAAPAESPTTPSSRLPFRVWDRAELATASSLLSRPIVRADSDDLFLPDDTELVGLTFSGINISAARVDHVGGGVEARTLPTDSNYVDVSPPMRLLELEALYVSKADLPAATGTITLHCSYLGRRFNAPNIPIEMPAGSGFERVVTFHSDEADRRKELLAHLQANRAHYSRAVFESLDSATIVMLLSQFTWNGRPLVEQVEPTPYGVAGNYLILPAPVEHDEPSGVTSVSGEMLSWGRLLDERNLRAPDPDQRLIPIPTGGVFAEAVLGRSNSAEKLDITRFWNWQDSPIPLSPPEITAISTGSRAQSDDLRPGQLSPPMLNIVNPTTLPDPSGLATVLGAVASGNMFRDMSGLAGTQGAAQAASNGTLAAATEAGKLASENMRTEMQKAVAMGQIAADVAKTAIAGHYALAQAKAGVAPKGTGAQGGGGVQGISGDGARINHGRSMDTRRVPGTSSVASPDGALESGGGTPTGNGTGVDGSWASSNDTGVPDYSREAAYADTGAFGYSPEGFHATKAPTVTEIPPVILASYGSGGATSFFLQRLKYVTNVLGFFVTKPVKVFLKYHKIHFSVLGKVLDAVRRGRNIQNAVRDGERNIDRLREEVRNIHEQAMKIHSDPLEGIPNWSTEDLAAMRSADAARARDLYLAKYRETVNKALLVVVDLKTVAERIENESRPLLQDLDRAVTAMPETNNAEVVVKLALIQDLQFLELHIDQVLAPLQRQIESAIAHLTEGKKNVEDILLI